MTLSHSGLLAAILIMALSCSAKQKPAVVAPTHVSAAATPERQFKVPRRFVVGIANLNGDERGEMREVIVDELSKLTGQLEIRRVDASALSAEQEVLYARGQEQAQSALSRAGVDLLIWGKVLRLDGKTMPRLYFAANHGAGPEGARYPLSESFGLPAEFWSELGNMVKLVVLSEASNFDDSRYQVAALRPFLERMEQLVASPRFTQVARDSEGSTWSSESRWEILHAYGAALTTFGEQAGDNESLERSIEVTRASLSDAEVVEGLPEEVNALARNRRARTQNNLGNALASLGERERGTNHLEQAVEAYREALKEWQRDRAPLNWALAQSNLGTALAQLGEREGGTNHLEQAATAFREALKESRRERVPLAWAMTQNNLGNVLSSLGTRESGSARLEEAVAAFREALKEYTRERVPLKWAMTQNNLGGALSILGIRESETARLEEAVVAYREALKECTRERVPLSWAMTQHNLANALTALGERESGTVHLEEAVVAAHEALKERTHERVPLGWAMSQLNLGNALRAIAGRRGRAPCDALEAHLAALGGINESLTPAYYATVKLALANDLRAKPQASPETCGSIPPQAWAMLAE